MADKQFVMSLRMPDYLVQLIKEMAKDHRRSLNSEIVYILEDAYNSYCINKNLQNE